MTSFEINPNRLHLAIAANNPQGVAANLASKGVEGVSAQSAASDLVSAAYKLEKEGFFEQFVADLTTVFNVPFDPDGEQSELLAQVFSNSLAPLVMSNAMAHEPRPHILVAAENYELLEKRASFWFVAALVLGGILLLKIIFRR